MIMMIMSRAENMYNHSILTSVIKENILASYFQIL